MTPRFLGLWSIAVMVSVAVFSVHLWIRYENVRLGYEVGRARREQARLLESRRLLSIEAASLRSADRIESFARMSLQMEVPQARQVISLSRTRRRRRASGKIW